ncbi:DUF177 domain-containing protein [candidate division KSB1 bacterium]|nr:DUF177 domain-containing protein [candidate division KSB1 bacterium]
MLILRIADLCEGHSEQRRQVSAEDLDLMEYQEFQAPIEVSLQMEKNGDQIIIAIEAHTTVSFICDRCIEPFTSPLHDRLNILYTSDVKLKNEQDEAICYVSPTTQEIDLADPLRQTLILALPAKRLCKPDCKGLCARCGANLNHEPCNCPTDQVDPRWEQLKDFLQ